MSPKKTSATPDSLSFEEAVKRLETIVEKLEEGSVPLDDVMSLYEEGIGLSKRCLEKLSQAELKLKRLTKDADGTLSLADGLGDEE